MIDGLITNFHLPESTLLMLVAMAIGVVLLALAFLVVLAARGEGCHIVQVTSSVPAEGKTTVAFLLQEMLREANTIGSKAGDADIAHLAGAPCRKTPKADMMGVTVMLSCAGINRERFL